MGSTQFGNFGNFCRDSTLPVCNLLSENHNQTGGWGGCELTGIPLSGGRRLGNLGTFVIRMEVTKLVVVNWGAPPDNNGSGDNKGDARVN